ncbi:MAG: DUF2318 domain-containing protein [Candidatus Latescibacteria bacterium]|nr:DUF2318 domain-containing protein [Candidatus Latescibacterota bacterium]
MLESLIITLREGVEAAIVIGIVAAYLRKTGRERLIRFVVWGVVLAVIASVAGAALFQRLAVSEEAFEGITMLLSALFVGSMMAWMWRTSNGLKLAIEEKVETLAAHAGAQAAPAGRYGIGLLGFTFLMIFREGIETVVFLSVVSLSTSGVMSLFGAGIGLTLAALFGVSFMKGSMRIDLGRFFKITGIVLAVLVVQLLINSLHELSEARILPSSEREMALVGPIVRQNLLFILAVVALPVIALLVPGQSAVQDETPSTATGAERRKFLAQVQANRRWRMLAGSAASIVILLLGLDYVYSDAPVQLSPAVSVTAMDGVVHIPAAQTRDGNLHRFGCLIDGTTVRFLLIQTGPGQIGTAFDACEICGSHGYYQDGREVICAHCTARIYVPTIGKGGGCNPIALPATVIGDTVVIKIADLKERVGMFR